jgi:hypothetical protein
LTRYGLIQGTTGEYGTVLYMPTIMWQLEHKAPSVEPIAEIKPLTSDTSKCHLLSNKISGDL